MHRLTTNDVAAVLRFLGVEAARAALLTEVQAVFGAYGIAVDSRHLSLIADFMTHKVGPGGRPHDLACVSLSPSAG